jgi:hypothetical protein
MRDRKKVRPEGCGHPNYWRIHCLKNNLGMTDLLDPEFAEIKLSNSAGEFILLNVDVTFSLMDAVRETILNQIEMLRHQMAEDIQKEKAIWKEMTLTKPFSTGTCHAKLTRFISPLRQLLKTKLKSVHL